MTPGRCPYRTGGAPLMVWTLRKSASEASTRRGRITPAVPVEAGPRTLGHPAPSGPPAQHGLVPRTPWTRAASKALPPASIQASQAIAPSAGLSRLSQPISRRPKNCGTLGSLTPETPGSPHVQHTRQARADAGIRPPRSRRQTRPSSDRVIAALPRLSAGVMAGNTASGAPDAMARPAVSASQAKR